MRSDTLDLVRARLRDSASVKQRLAALHLQDVAAAADLFTRTVAEGGTVYLCGNGGSASDAQHLATELTGRFVQDRRPLPAVALTTDTSALTAIANDYGFEQVFERQVRALGRPGDVLVAISTSGRSENVARAVAAARAIGMRTVGLTGGDGGTLAAAVDVAVVVPSSVTARIQEAHITLGHIFCEVMERAVFDRRSDLDEAAPGVVDLAALEALRRRWAERGRTVVWTNGCFDLLHVGHLRGLAAARALGDVLVVGLNEDDSVRRLKGAGRPLVPFAERAELLAALEPVDAVVGFGEDTPVQALSRLRPDIVCKGEDYAEAPLPERATVESYGGQVVLLPLVPDRSTSALASSLGAGVGRDG